MDSDSKTAPIKKCPRCEADLPVGAPEGLCPPCLLKRGFETRTPLGQVAAFSPPSPDQLAGHFPGLEILELLGRGGMGVVYKARQRDLERLVALKILPSNADHDPAFAERFTREARALARLSHPNIVTIHDFGQIDGLFYFLMEYVDGVNLRQFMGAQKVPPGEALVIVPQICGALQYAHDKGIVHRDIKPENILLDKNGSVRIADFGLAKIMTPDPADLTLTEAGQVMGTTHYMSPEQIEHPQDVDHRADIYSLGVVFYQMLTGELPIGRFASPSQKVQIDVRLDEVVLRTLEKEPELRFHQAGEIKTRIEGIRSTPPPRQKKRAQSAEGPKRAPGLLLRMPLAIMLSSFAAMAAVGTAAVFVPKKYVSRATIQCKKSTGDATERIGEIPRLIIESTEVLYPVIASLNLAGKWGTTDKEKLSTRLRRELAVRPIRNTELIEIAITDGDPHEAATLANAIAVEFQKNRLSHRRQEDQQRLIQLENEIESQRTKVDALRTVTDRIRDELGVLDLHPEEDGNISHLQMQASDLAVKVAALRAFHKQLAAMTGEQMVNALPSLGIQHSTITRILPQYQEAAVEEQTLRNRGLGPNHPDLQSVRGKKEALKKLLDDEIPFVLQAQESELKAAESTLKNLQQSVLEAQQQSDTNAGAYLKAKNDYFQAKKLLETAEERLKTEKMQANTLPAPVVIWQRAEPLVASNTPRILSLLIVGALVGACAGIGLAFVPHSLGILITASVLFGLLWAAASWSQGDPSQRSSLRPTEVREAAPPQAARISVGGEVKNPQLVPYSADLTVLRVIAAAGGFGDYADQRKVRLIRDGKLQIINISAIRKDPGLDVPLKPGDSIDVPQSFW